MPRIFCSLRIPISLRCRCLCAWRTRLIPASIVSVSLLLLLSLAPVRTSLDPVSTRSPLPPITFDLCHNTARIPCRALVHLHLLGFLTSSALRSSGHSMPTRTCTPRPPILRICPPLNCICPRLVPKGQSSPLDVAWSCGPSARGRSCIVRVQRGTCWRADFTIPPCAAAVFTVVVLCWGRLGPFDNPFLAELVV